LDLQPRFLLTLWAAAGRHLPGEHALLAALIANRNSILDQPALIISHQT
jgi:hypothetical protein